MADSDRPSKRRKYIRSRSSGLLSASSPGAHAAPGSTGGDDRRRKIIPARREYKMASNELSFIERGYERRPLSDSPCIYSMTFTRRDCKESRSAYRTSPHALTVVEELSRGLTPFQFSEKYPMGLCRAEYLEWERNMLMRRFNAMDVVVVNAWHHCREMDY